jgi:ribosomal protein S18 acetylase RimI-like enzyme
MMTDAAGVTFDQHDGQAAGKLAEDLAHLFRAAYTSETDPFYSCEQFLYRFDRYRAARGFLLITAHSGRRLVGFLYGYPLRPGSRWWDGLTPPPPSGFTDETGHRTFAINDMAVAPGLRRRGIAQAMHALLVAHRPEMRFTLAVTPDNVPAQAAYLKWGYQPVGRPAPAFSGAPALDLMVRPPGIPDGPPPAQRR